MIINSPLTSKPIKQKILNYTLWLRGDKSIDKPTFNNTDFNNINFEDLDSNFNLFKNLDLKYSDFSNSKFGFFSFTNTDLTESNFQNTIIENVDFGGCILKGADFRGIKTLPELTKKQLDDIILTDEDYKNYQERKKLEEENKKLKKEVKQKNETIEIIGEKQTDKLIDGFEKLKKNYQYEESIWISISFIVFISLLFVSLIPLFDIFAFQYTYKLIFWGGISIFGLIILLTLISAFPYNEIEQNNEIEKNKKGFWSFIWTFLKKGGFFILIYLIIIIGQLSNFIGTISSPTSRVFNINIQYGLVPLGIILSTCLYFSLYQYSKAKQLRIENQNKIAILHGFQALRAEKGDGVEKGRFYDNISNVVFTKVYNKKISNDLPVDKLVELAISNLLKKQ